MSIEKFSCREVCTRNNIQDGILGRFNEGSLEYGVGLWRELRAFGDGNNGVFVRSRREKW